MDPEPAADGSNQGVGTGRGQEATAPPLLKPFFTGHKGAERSEQGGRGSAGMGPQFGQQ